MTKDEAFARAKAKALSARVTTFEYALGKILEAANEGQFQTRFEVLDLESEKSLKIELESLGYKVSSCMTGMTMQLFFDVDWRSQPAP